MIGRYEQPANALLNGKIGNVLLFNIGNKMRHF